jgi:hypothetical protein
MQSSNSSSVTKINISLYYKVVDDKIFKDQRFIELMNLLLKENNIYKYNYAFYTDSFLLRSNLYIPNFHTLYLSTNSHNVVLSDEKDVWLLDIFKHNKYYILNNPKDPFDYSALGIKKIQNIKDII